MRAYSTRITFAIGLWLLSSVVSAETLKPFILAYRAQGDVAVVAEEAKKRLVAAGFDVVAAYSPYLLTQLLIVTNDEMRQNAAKSQFGGYGAAQRVAITKVGDEVQVSYTNPVYMAHAYRMEGDLKPVADRLAQALGAAEPFGPAQGLEASKLRKYHYMFGMEYFDEPSELAEYDSHEKALKTVEERLAQGVSGITKVYRIDIPGKQESVFGVAMRSPKNKYQDDAYIMSEIDFKPIRSTAHLPYEMLVSGNKVYALYARFRIAIDFPDLAMMGKHSFMNIMETPAAIEKALTLAAGGKPKKEAWE